MSGAAARPVFGPIQHPNREYARDILRSRFEGWQKRSELLASEALSQVPFDRPLDLVSTFLQPWCLRSALVLADIPEAHERCLADLMLCLSRRDAQPDDSRAQSDAKKANRELDEFFASRRGLEGKAIFLGMAQTMPAFLASAWCALFENSKEWMKLRTNPHVMTTAIEELLRFAGPVHTLFRQTETDCHLLGREISRGSRLALKVDSANHDSEKFSNPHQLNLTRRAGGHLSLGAGLNSCIGASVVRASTAIATWQLLQQSSLPELSGDVEWSCGTMLLWPSSLPTVLRSPRLSSHSMQT
jgi:cytochrome P450